MKKKYKMNGKLKKKVKKYKINGKLKAKPKKVFKAGKKHYKKTIAEIKKVKF